MSFNDRAAKGKIRKQRMKDKAKRWVKEYLLEHPCVDCGNTDIRVLEFDHREPAKKSFTICRKVCSDGVSLLTLAKEVAKCDVRCANCHRIRTKEDRHYGPNDKSGGLVGGLPKKVEIFHKRMGILSD